MGFNPLAHVGRDKKQPKLRYKVRCFNPRAHVGRDKTNFDMERIKEVSIHAPTWGATAY